MCSGPARGQCSLIYRHSFLGRLATTGGGIASSALLFLTPLLLTAHLGIPFQPLLRSRLEGIPPEEALRYFYGLRRFKRGVPSHIWFPARAERGLRRRERAGQPPQARTRRQPRIALFALLDSLKRLIERLSYKPLHSDWSQYTENHSYECGGL